MKYFAKLGLNSEVVSLTHILDSNAPTEKEGIEFLHKQTNYPSWVQTFKDRSQRKHYAGIGFIYDEDRDAFFPKQPYASWVLNETTYLWESPVAHPYLVQMPPQEDEKNYNWNEETTSWDLVE